MDKDYILPESLSDTLTTSKEDIERFAAAIRHNILEGVVSAEQALLSKKMISDAFEKVFSDPVVKEYLESEIRKHPKAKVIFKGAEISFQSKRNWDFKSCGDNHFNQLVKELEERKEFLKALKSSVTLVDDLTGEVATVHPPTYTTSEYFTVSIKKK